jgi:hypothetical protein
VLSRGLWTLVNAFDFLEFQGFPAVHSGFDVVVVLSDVRGSGEAGIELEIIDFEAELEDALNAALWFDALEVELSPKLSREWLRFRTGEITFPRAGVYEIRVLKDGELVETGTIRVQEINA